MSISTKFETFCNNLKISNENLEKISYRYHQITKDSLPESNKAFRK